MKGNVKSRLQVTYSTTFNFFGGNNHGYTKIIHIKGSEVDDLALKFQQFDDNLAQSAGHVSKEAMGFIRELLLLDPKFRMTADECLKHPWLTSEDESDVLKTLETSWMKQG